MPTTLAGALASLSNPIWGITCLPAVAKYIETGDPDAYESIKLCPRGDSVANPLSYAMAPIAKWTATDRRICHALHKMGQYSTLSYWVHEQLEREVPEQDSFSIVLQELANTGDSRQNILLGMLKHANLIVNGRPTSAGRYLLSLPDAELDWQVKNLGHSHWTRQILTKLLVDWAPERLDPLVDALLDGDTSHFTRPRIVENLLAGTGDKYIPQILRTMEQVTYIHDKFSIAQHLYQHDPVVHHQRALETARLTLVKTEGDHASIASWMIENFGETILPDLIAHARQSTKWPSETTRILNAAVKNLGKRAEDALLTALDAASTAKPSTDARYGDWKFEQFLELRRTAVGHLVTMNENGAYDGRIEEEIRRTFEGKKVPFKSTAGFIRLLGQWNPQRLEEPLWKFMTHKSKVVRSAAARALAKLGDAAIPRADELLRARKADTRATAATLLVALDTQAAMAALEARLDEETSDDVRDLMLLGLASAWAKQGRTITQQDVAQRIAKAGAAGALEAPVAAWLAIDNLPALHWNDGSALDREAVAYLLYRQARAREIVPDVEAAPMYDLIDRSRSGEFARAILEAFLRSKQEASDRWALTLAGLLGDDRIVPLLTAQIRAWVDTSRGKLAEWAVQALALVGSDAAMLAVDAMSIRYRTRMKNVGRAASEAFIEAARKQGISPEELGDRVVPWLGFEPGKPRIVDAAGNQIEVTIDLNMKLAYRDLGKGKVIKSLPKSAPKEVLAELKSVAANLKEIAKAQWMRLENLMVRQRRWPVQRWQELFLQHPLLLPFAVRLIWAHDSDDGVRRATFRALPDRTLTTHDDEPVELPADGSIGMIHPLELDAGQQQAWQSHLDDYEIEPPFPQLQRPVMRCSDAEKPLRRYKDLESTSINGMTFKGRAEKLGWYRGSVVDAGTISSYYKTFPAAGVDAFVMLDGFYIGIDMESEIQLGEAFFVKHKSVTIGSYVYDEPYEDNDGRLVALGDVPAIVFSEVMGDLRKIAGVKETDVEAGTDEAADAMAAAAP